MDVTVTSDRETVASRGEYTPAGDGFVLTFSIGDGKYEITHGESDTVLSVGGLLSYTISFAAAGAVAIMIHLQILEEEKHLAKMFGAPYLTYKKGVRRYL